MVTRYQAQTRLPAVVSEAERERVVEALQRQFVAGGLDAEQLSLRVREAYAARTREALAEAAGVPLAAAQPTFPVSPPAPVWAPPVPSRRSGVGAWVVSIMGSVTRKGGWRVAEQSVALAIMGNCELDLRQAVLASAEPQIVALSCMGTVTIIVPEGMAVEVTGVPLLGSLECKTNDLPPPSNAPVIRLRVVGLACLGSVTVKSRPGGAPVLAGGHAW